MTTQKKYRLGLVIGRFQPFHLGHKYLIEKALELCDEIIIGIGSSNKKNSKNPYSYSLRKKMIEKFLKEEGYADRVKKIFSSVDIPDDYKWRDAILQKAGQVDVVVGNNDEGSNRFFEEAGIPIARIGFHKRHLLEGAKIRYNMKNQKPWKKRVPHYLIKHIE